MPEQQPLLPRVCCIMLTHNGLHMTQDAYSNMLALDYPEDRIGFIVVDNASTDGTQRWLSSLRGDNVSTIYLNPAKSVAGAWNYALEWCFSQRQPYDACFVLNNDIVLRADSLKWLVAAAEPFVTCVGVNNPEQLGKPVKTMPKGKRPRPDFSAYLISKQVWQRVGRFNEDYEIAYAEDCEYHVRMHFAGIKAYCIDVPYIHYGSGSIKSADPSEKRTIQRAAERNRKRFADEYGCEIGSPEYDQIFES